MASEQDFSWEDDLMTKSYQRQESHLTRLAKSHGKDYGKPKAGSESDKRSKEYQKNVIQEVVSLCYQISLHGFKSKDGKEQILFGDLFKLNEKISNKCVGLLQRARKYRLLHFPGETLWQGADDNVVISLLRKNREIQVYFTHTKRLLPNNTAGNLWLDVESERRVHQDWTMDVREVNPFLLSYHVQVQYAEEEDLEVSYILCDKMVDLQPRIQANSWIEPPVIFKLPSVTILPPVLKMACHLTFYCQEFLEVDRVHTTPLPPPVSVDVQIISAILVKCSNISLTTSQLCQRRPPPPSPPPPVPLLEPVNIRPRPKLVLEPPELPSPPPLRPVKPNLPDFPKMKIKFSTCTTLYVPAKPIYENYKKNVQEAARTIPSSTHSRYKYNRLKK